MKKMEKSAFVLKEKVGSTGISSIVPNENAITYEDRVLKFLKSILKDDLYVAKHLGRGGKSIYVPKIRTMHNGAESQLEKVVKKNGFAKDDKPKDDPRIIPSRRWMRKWFIDELPQLPYNLFRRKDKRTFRCVGVRSKSEGYLGLYPKQHQKRILKSPYYCGFFGVHRYNPKRTGTQNERRYMAEHKLANKKYLTGLRHHLINLKYGSVIAYNIVSRRTRGG